MIDLVSEIFSQEALTTLFIIATIVIVSGEITFHTIGLFVANGSINIYLGFLFPIVLTTVVDLSAFVIMVFFKKLFKKKLDSVRRNKNLAKFMKFIESKKSENKDTLILLLIKILPGTKFLIFFYLAVFNPKFKKFVVIDFATTLFWTSMLVTSGILIGKGILTLSEDLFIELAVLYVLAIIGIGYLFKKEIKKVCLRFIKLF